ncbi:hypothetical protein LC607_13785 [Nostoc sp. CHAB 5824]|nr:hypothetical protein [Nostoc sp. CHAB 5824]
MNNTPKEDAQNSNLSGNASDFDIKIADLKNEIKKEFEHISNKEKANGKIRTSIRIFKLTAIICTSFGALVTGITQDKNAAYFTAVAGFLSTVSENIDKEFSPNKMRIHSKIYVLKYKELLEEIEYNHVLPKDKLLVDSQDKFQELRRQEVQTRPSLQE